MDYLDRPQWSAFREPSFGHGMLLLQNTTHAQWRWHRNQVRELVHVQKQYPMPSCHACKSIALMCSGNGTS